MAEIFDVYDQDHAQIGAIPISPQQREQLHAGSVITISFHTPRMLNQLLGARNGAFDVREINGRLVVTDSEQAKRYIELQADVGRAMKQPEKWTDPDAESNSSVR